MTETKSIRSPITVILGHVDSGKTSLLDKVRGSAVQLREAGGITQHIGASFFPASTVEALCAPIRKITLELPGVLIIDTPGHASFMNLRARGASMANFAILVIDVLDGVQPQTVESLRILRQNKVPFLIALNKIDRLGGWQSSSEEPLTVSIPKQHKNVREHLQNVIYELQTDLGAFGFDCDQFDKISDFSKKIAIIPTSAKTGEGIPEMFLVLVGLAQSYLKSQLELHISGNGIGSVLEMKEEVGLGKTINVILYDGVIRKGDRILVAGMEGVIETKVKALLLPSELDEIRDPKDRFIQVDSVTAAIGLKIAGTDSLEKVVAGSPLYVIKTDEESDRLYKELTSELNKFRVQTDKEGIVLKADSLGTLEAIVQYLRERGIKIRWADVGKVSKKDIVEATIAKERDERYGVILAFQTEILPDAREEAYKCKIKVFNNDIIYRLHESYEEWLNELEEQKEMEALKGIIYPARLKMLPYIFNAKDPAIVGVEVLSGKLMPRVTLIKEDNRRIGVLKQIQSDNKTVSEANVGQQVAVSIQGPIAGRNLKSDDIMLVDLPEKDAIKIQQLRKFFSPSVLETLDSLIEIKRKFESRFWALPP
ncbi:MAG: translation initiation factor IF-2 [Candidatus Hermodarchaeota archaeon]